MPKTLPEKIVSLHESLKAVNIPHGFGGALALAWCTQQARGTIDIDLNIFVEPADATVVLQAMPGEVTWTENDVETVKNEGQVRVWWDNTPIDVFLNTLDLHQHMARRCRWEVFTGRPIPFLSCQDIAILKVFFNRTKDWADLEEMQVAGTLDLAFVMATIIEHLGPDDERVNKLVLLGEKN